ncbi:thymidylate synthase [Bacillus sp. JCM 19047]|nr:thymidylate synthase [Bacillus sp. JCM 19047]
MDFREQDLRNMGVKIWNEWEQEDLYHWEGLWLSTWEKESSSDGEKVDQVDYLIQQLKNNPASRRHITVLWNPDELDDMSLTPCVYEIQWHVKENKLHLEVRSRSNDMGLGNPFNVFQYNGLHRMIAQVTGYELGEYIYNIGDAHVYDRHEEALKQQAQSHQFEPPTLKINKQIRSFYDFTIDDFELINYKHGEKIEMEVAI